MKKFLLLFLLLILAGSVYCPGLAFAQPREGVQSFGQDDAWRRRDGSRQAVLQTIIDSVGPAGMLNVTEAEQVFCYEVIARPMNYTGYTINNMALTGFCGVVNQEVRDMLITELFGTESNISFGPPEDCMVNPRMFLRFMRGVDNTDVLLSSPCHSITVFYAGRTRTYNFRPSAEMIDTIINSFHARRMNFTSPALLGQVFPVGVVQGQQQQQVIDRRSEPVRNWEADAPAQPGRQPGGWNQLNF
jgi:hypothetical protein